MIVAIRRGERVERFETVRRAKDGRLIDVSIAVSPIRDSTGHVVGASKTARDITGRRRASEALARSERRLRLLAEELTIERAHLLAAQSVARMGSWSTDLRTMAATWSAETHRIFETDPATFAPTHEQFLAMVHQADRAAVDQAFTASLESPATKGIAHRIALADGRIKFVEETWQVTHADDGTPLRAVGTVQDISERKEAEARVRTADARLRAILNNAPIVIIAVNHQGIFTLAEGEGLARVGLAPGALVGQPAAELYRSLEITQPDGSTISGPDALRRVLAGELVSGLSHRVSESFDNHFFPERSADGDVVGLIGVSTVVTARHRAEAQLAESMAELQAVSIRLNEAREQERAKMARDIHDHLGQALTALKMDVAEVRRRVDAGETAIVRERLGEMASLIDSSVDDVRRVAAELRPVVLDDLGFVAAMRAYFIDVERRAQIRCVLKTSLTDLSIADERAIALFRILQEALTNVVRHADAKRVDVCLTVEAGSVRLVVHDDGRGIPAAVTRNPRALGLVGMRDRALLFGGDVAVSGGPGEGTTVTVNLPLTGPPT